MHARLTALAATALALLVAGCGGAAPAAAPSQATGAAPATSGAKPAAASPAAAGPGTSASTAASPGLQAIVDGAKKEGALNLMWSGNAAGGPIIPQLADGFNKLYGLNLKVQFTPGPDFATFADKVVQEHKAGQPASSDALLMAGTGVNSALQDNLLLADDWSWASNIHPPSIENNAFVNIETYLFGITYNVKKFPAAAPKTMKDLLDPKYKGRIATHPAATGFDAMSAMWGKEAALAYATKFADQVGGLLRCGTPESITSGEFDVYAIDCSQGPTLHAKAMGQPLDYVVPSDFPVIDPIYLGVPKNSAHPNAAKLWINYVESRDGQDRLYQSDFEDAHTAPGSKTAQLIDQMKSQGVQFTSNDVKFYQSHNLADLSAFTKKVQGLLQQKAK